MVNIFLNKKQEDIETFKMNLKMLCSEKKYGEALAIAKQALREAEDLLGKNHPYLTPYLDMLAGIYELHNLHAKAEAIHKRTLRIWENVFVPRYRIIDMLKSSIYGKTDLERNNSSLTVPHLIKLTEDLHLGTGDNRSCYAFPNDPEKCIKIEKPWNTGLHNKPKKRLKRKIMPWLADFSSNREECRFYRIKARGLGEKFYKHAPRCYGIILTNLGPGLVFERIRDHNGEYSQRLDQFLHKNPDKVNQAMELLAELFAYVLENDLPIFCWNHENLVFRKNLNDNNLVVIDWKSQGNPNNDFPLAYLSSRLKKRKMQKQFIKLLLSLSPQSGKSNPK